MQLELDGGQCSVRHRACILPLGSPSSASVCACNPAPIRYIRLVDANFVDSTSFRSRLHRSFIDEGNSVHLLHKRKQTGKSIQASVDNETTLLLVGGRTPRMERDKFSLQVGSSFRHAVRVQIPSPSVAFFFSHAH